MIPRYRTMKGYEVPRKAGWDTHGLPVELEVEKLLGLDGKEQIEEYGLAPFIDKCKESVWKYKGMWEEMCIRDSGGSDRRAEKRGKNSAHAAERDDVQVPLVQAQNLSDGRTYAAADLQCSAFPSG